MAGDVTTGWVSEPDTRGTFRLVFSCLIALSLCVWLALEFAAAESVFFAAFGT